jgi:hypothetical protein
MSNAPRGFVPYCDDYRCAGDCGLPHNEDERVRHFTKFGRAQERKRLTLAAFDALASDKRRPVKDASDAIRRRAKESL